MTEFTSKRSIRVRLELARDLQVVVDEAIKHIGFSLIDGKRDDAQQLALFNSGKSKLDGISKRSKHQGRPRWALIDPDAGKSLAFDFIPWPFTTWEDRPIFTAYAHFFLGIGIAKGIELTWGGDWDKDFHWRDQTFHDLPHIELAWPT